MPVRAIRFTVRSARNACGCPHPEGTTYPIGPGTFGARYVRPHLIVVRQGVC